MLVFNPRMLSDCLARRYLFSDVQIHTYLFLSSGIVEFGDNYYNRIIFLLSLYDLRTIRRFLCKS